jgi:hypothetical protein
MYYWQYQLLPFTSMFMRFICDVEKHSCLAEFANAFVPRISI